MWALQFLAVRRYSSLLVRALAAPFDRSRSLAGALLVILAFPLFILWQALHWLGLALDEVFFRGYRSIAIRDPLFVIGPPRTGTTFLHHVLARDPAYTTFRTWECLFGLSVTARKVGLALGRLDRLLGRPAGRLAAVLGRAVAGPLDDIHPLRLDEPEEDFLCLMPIAACFLLVVPFPNADWLWRTARLDTDIPERERRQVIGWYRRCIQKHLYVFGEERKYLSKNASFCGLMDTLLDEFPDARILVTWRDPGAAVPSQLSSLRPALKVVGYRNVTESFRDALTDLTCYYFLHSADVEERRPGRVTTITNDDLRQRLDVAVEAAYARLGLAVSPELRQILDEYTDVSRASRSTHRYSLDEFGFDEELIRSRFARVYERRQRPPDGAGS